LLPAGDSLVPTSAAAIFSTKEYLLLFNTIIDTENALDALRKKLINALDEAEDLYINKED